MSESTSPSEVPPAGGSERQTLLSLADEKLIGRCIVGSGSPRPRSQMKAAETGPAEPGKLTLLSLADEKLIGRSIVGSGTPIRPVFWWLRRRKRRA